MRIRERYGGDGKVKGGEMGMIDEKEKMTYEEWDKGVE